MFDDDLRTLVAVPTLLISLKEIEEQIARLEIHYLASAQGDLHFALLSDWRDAPSEHVDGDEELLAAAQEGIARLNQRYGPVPGGERFLLLHRRRVWNEGESRWIGWERKRGKLEQLNRYLMGQTEQELKVYAASIASITSDEADGWASSAPTTSTLFRPSKTSASSTTP